MVEISDLRAALASNSLFKRPKLNVRAGEVHAIMGSNGAGKSTLAYAFGGRDEGVG